MADGPMTDSERKQQKTERVEQAAEWLRAGERSGRALDHGAQLEAQGHGRSIPAEPSCHCHTTVIRCRNGPGNAPRSPALGPWLTDQ